MYLSNKQICIVSFVSVLLGIAAQNILVGFILFIAFSAMTDISNKV
jgi:hypothetical protein